MKKKDHCFLYESEGLAKIGMRLTKRQASVPISLLLDAPAMQFSVCHSFLQKREEGQSFLKIQ